MSTPDIAIALGTAVAPTAVNLLRSYGKRRYDEFIATYTNVLNAFLASTEDKCSVLKTLLNPDVPIELHKLYVQTLFGSGANAHTDISVIERAKTETGGFAITGYAGSGKSMFMKWAALKLIDEMPNHQRIPLFIEVRDLEFDDQDVPLEDIIFKHCSNAESHANFDQFKIGLREGLFILMLDGVDETPPDRLHRLLLAIKSFHNKYRQCVIIASVRPGTQLPNIPRFRVLQVRPMTLEQVELVLKKAPYDENRKKLLLESLQGGLYETHRSFLSNPLLVTIMLITFDDASRVPENLTGFYSAAFDALFSRHDWSKGIFVRKHASGLEKVEFERVFTYFCYQSYFYSNYIFSRDQVLELIHSSIKLAGLDVKTNDYLNDCILAVCLLQIDEPRIIFVHRTFQEYFTAKFISRYSGPKLPRMIDWLSARSSTDNTFLMAAQLNREAIIRSWGIPKSNELLEAWHKHMECNDPVKVLNGLGISEIVFDVRTGELAGYAGSHGQGLNLMNGLLTLGFDSPRSAHHFALVGNVYGGLAFVDLPARLKSFILRETKSGMVTASLNQWPSGETERSLLSHLANQQVRLVEENLAKLETFIATQDCFADMVDLVHPSEAGASTE